MRWNPKQIESARNATAAMNYWDGAVRSGKTEISMKKWIKYLTYAPPGPLGMIGKTERTLRRNILKPIEDFLGPSLFRYNIGSGEAHILGRLCYVYGANDERSEGKIRGATLAGWYGDELPLWPESFFKTARARCSVPGAQIFATGNPESPFHYFKTEYIDRRNSLDFKYFHFTLDDNIWLCRDNPDYVRNLKAEYSGVWYKRYIDGLWVVAEGVIYDMFDPDRHIIGYHEYPIHDSFVAVDYGTNNPCVFLCFRKTPIGLIVSDEYYYDSKAEMRQKADAEYRQDMGDFFRLCGLPAGTVIYCDPSALSFINELNRNGFNAVPAVNDVIPGIKHVSRELHAGRLFFTGRCQRTIKEFQEYSWDKNAQKKGKDEPLKKNDHGCDTVRYGSFSDFKSEIKVELF